MVFEIDQEGGWTAGLMYKYSFDMGQASQAMQHLTAQVNTCWQENFLSSASEPTIQKVVNAYKTNKAQFVMRKVPALKNALNQCVSNVKTYLQEGVDNVIANN